MNRSASVAAIALLLAVITLTAVPLTAETDNAATVTTGGVTVVGSSDSFTVKSDSSTTIYLSIYNNNSEYVTVAMVDDGIMEDTNITFSSNYLVMNGNSAIGITAKISVGNLVPSGTHTDSITAKVIDNLGNESAVTMTMTITVNTNYDSSDSYNKIVGIYENPLPAPYNDLKYTVMISIGIWVAISAAFIAFYDLILRIFMRRHAEERLEVRKHTDKMLVSAVMLNGVANIMGVVGMNGPLVNMFNQLAQILYVIIGAYIVWGIYKVFISIVFSKFEKTDDIEGVDTSLIPLFWMIGKILIVVTAIAAIMAMLGFNLTAIVTGAGIAGLAVSLGAQSTLNEFFSGIMILLTRPFKEGDMIRMGTSTDVLQVKRVYVMHTEFKNWVNNEYYTMPNSTVAKSTIINLTGKSRAYCIYVEFSISYSSDVELAKKLIYEATYEHPQVITDGSYSKPEVRFYAFDDSCITLRLSAYVNDFEDNGRVAGELREAVFKKFNENGVDIPFNQLDVNLHQAKD
jgi:potassium efflux system protein